MAKFIPGPLVSEIRNALGSQVFSRNQWGAYTRARVNPHETPTDDRVIAQDAMIAAALAWGTTLTDSQRLAWNAFARSMAVRAHSPIATDLNGFALFHKLWLLALWWSANTLTDPPPDLNTPLLTNATLTSDGALAQLFVTFAPTPVPAGQIIMVYATPPLNAGVSRPYRWFKPVTLFPSGTASPQNIWIPYETAHGTPIPDKKIFSRCSAAFTYNNFPAVPLQSVTLVMGVPDTLLKATVVLTDAQIKALPTTAVTVVAAIAGKLIVPFMVTLQLDATAGAYTNLSAGTGDRIRISGPLGRSFSVRNNVLLTPAEKRTTFLPPLGALDAAPNTSVEIYTNVDQDGDIEGTALTINAVNAAGDFTGGNALNEMTVTTFYDVVNPI